MTNFRSSIRNFSLAALLAASSLEAKDPSVSMEKKAAAEYASSLALQAAAWGGPLVTMYALRYHDAFGPNPKAPPDTIWRMEDIATPELSKQAGYVTPNVNVIYGFGFLDLRQEPIVLEAPDSNNRYYLIQIVDMWTNSFAYIGGKATGYKGGKFLLAGPGWKGTVPPGLVRIDCPTPWILIQPRVHAYVKGQLDLPGAREILRQIKPTGLASFTGQTPPPEPVYDYIAPVPVNPDLPVSDMNYKDPLQFWDILSAALNENPPPQDQLSALLPLFKPLGLEYGKKWDRKKLSPEIIESMKEGAIEIGSVLAHLPFGTQHQGAFIPPATIGDPGTDYLTRAVVARVGLTANTPYEAIYWMYTLDSEGHLLIGSKKYTLTFSEELPCYEPGFWSITLYDAKNNYTVPNPINRYMLGSDTPELKKNSDGSFTIYIQKESPGKEKESNWLPAPSGPFYLVPRAYAPKPEAIGILSNPASWPVPAARRQK